MKWFIKCLKNYAVFRGRARRKEYWMFVLVSATILFALGLLASIINPGIYNNDQALYGANSMDTVEPGPIGFTLTLLIGVFFLFICLPSIAVAVRRLHDTGRSGWWYWIVLIPLVGGIIQTILLLLGSEANENKYGKNPKKNDITSSSLTELP